MTETVLVIVEDNHLVVSADITPQTEVIITDQLLVPVKPQFVEYASVVDLSPNPATSSVIGITAQDQPLAVNNPQGSGYRFVLRIQDNGSAQPISFDTKYRGVGMSLPASTVPGKMMYLGFMHNPTNDTWDLVAKAQG